MQRLVATAAFALACALCSQARAQEHAIEPVRVSVEDESGLGCIDAALLRSELAARVGRDPVRDDAAREVHIQVRTAGRALVAELTIREDGVEVGARQIRTRGRRCAELLEDLLLTLQLVVDSGPTPVAESEPASPGSAAPVSDVRESDAWLEPTAAPDIAVVDSSPSEPVAAPDQVVDRDAPHSSSAAPLRLRLEAEVVAVWGAQPNVLPALDIGASLSFEWLVVALGARLPAIDGFALEGGGAVGTWLGTGRVRVGARLEGFELCAVLAVGALVAEGRELEAARRVTVPFVGVGAQAAYTWTFVEHLGVRVFVELLGHAVGADVLVSSDDIWGTGDISGAAGAGLYWES